MNTAARAPRKGPRSAANTALRAAARSWFAVATIGQFAFAFTIASFYGLTALRGHIGSWNRFITHGYVRGDAAGNFTVAAHLSSAAFVMISGALQLIPAIRQRFPAFHRWNGRAYVLSAVAIGVAGLYMTWIRGTVGDDAQHVAATLNVALLLLSAAMAVRHAIARELEAHRRWALRLFLVVSAAWFFRVAFFLSLVLFGGPFGFDPTTFSGPFLTALSFGQYLFPLAVLELYLFAERRPGALGNATAALLFALTGAMGAGILAVTAASWLPRVEAAYDRRSSVADALAATVAESGVEEAARQYHALRAGRAADYNFDERELNGLGYRFLRSQKYEEAIRFLQLNVEAYPRSSNAYDSLAEAYLGSGKEREAIANYRRSLELDPKNRGAALMLRKLGAL